MRMGVMECLFCKYGNTAPDDVTVTLQRGEATVVLKKVPAEVCQCCGEYTLSDSVTNHVLTVAETAIREGAVLVIAGWAARHSAPQV